ncbi:alanine racemase [Myxococcota bacterium]|nr:alanine racemase [Myxococcota bacterium]
MKGDRPTVVTISLGAIRSNYRLACRMAAGRDVIAVVKADAYGHGARSVAPALAQAGCGRFAVVTVGEAAELREVVPGASILLLGGVHDALEARSSVELGLTPVIHHADHVALLAEAASGGAEPLPIHVEVDTGMNRMGVQLSEALPLMESIDQSPNLVLDGVYTHLARADEADLGDSMRQIAEFRSLLEACRDRGVRPGLVHVANSAGLAAGPAIARALPEAGAVRPGILLYGAQPSPHAQIDLRPAMTLRTQVVNLRSIPAGTSVGYSALYRAEQATRIATLAIGYADGIPVAASGRGRVLIRGKSYPMAGRVSMDFVTVDVGERDSVEIGDEAILFGEGQGAVLPVDDAARASETLSYELLVRVGARVPREYIDGP